MAKLAQAYIYLRPFEVSEPRLIGFARATEATAAEVAQRVYDVEISIDVDLEAGSLKARITVIGSIAVFLYTGIADYKGFKESIGELCKDAREYAYDVCGGVLRLTGASEKEMVKTEKRDDAWTSVARLSTGSRSLRQPEAPLMNGKDIKRSKKFCGR